MITGKRREWKIMSKKLLVVVDMQKDFVDGSLGTAEAVSILPKVTACVEAYRRMEDSEIVFTRDTHEENYLQTQEGRLLPVVHCIRGSEGWQLVKEVEALRTEADRVFDKPTFGSVELGRYVAGMDDLEEVALIGLCTDICVISNALLIKANKPEVSVSVIADCCAGVTPESHKNALSAMKMTQISIVNE